MNVASFSVRGGSQALLAAPAASPPLSTVRLGGCAGGRQGNFAAHTLDHTSQMRLCRRCTRGTHKLHME